MRLTRRRLLAGTGALAATTLCGSFLPARSEATAPSLTGTINVAVAGDLGGLDPTRSIGIIDRQLMSNAYDGLVRFAPTSFQIRPGVAERWTISPDGKTYTFSLRRNAQFWDGTLVKSDAVKFTFEREFDQANPGYQYSGHGGVLVSVIDHVEAPDDYTFKLILKRPSTPVIQFLTDRPGYIVQPKTALAMKSDFGQKGMGAGQFKIDEYQHNVRTGMSANPYYWGPKARVQGLNFVVIPEPQGRVAALQSGTVDMIYNPDPDLLPTLQTDPNVNIQNVVGSHAAFLCLNRNFKPFQDVRVRRAIDLAINKQAIANTLLKGAAVVAKTPLSEAYGPYYLKDFPSPVYDPTKAKQLLEQAGYGSGLDVRLISGSNSSGEIKVVDQCTAIQADLAKIGVRLKIQTFDEATHGTMHRQADAFDMDYSSFSSVIGDPHNMLYGVFSSPMWPSKGFNYSFYQNEKVDSLLLEGEQIQDTKRRVEIYTQVQKTIADDVAVVLLVHQTFSMAMKKKVKGFHLHPNLNFVFSETSIG